MLPVGALAVAVLLNGVQIVLPAPAFVAQGRTWAPARAIFQRLGHKVQWDPAFLAMTIQLPGQPAVFQIGSPPTRGGQPMRTDLAARRVEGTVYVPLLALRELGLRVHWDTAARQVILAAQRGSGRANLAAILGDPPAWDGEEVTLTGEYLGWTPDRFSFTTKQGPPVSSGDWVLHNEDGSIYCSPGAAKAAPVAAASLSPVTSPLPALTPYAALGQRFAVTGTVRLTHQAIPYLEFTRLSRPVGLAGLTCRLVLSRQQYEPGQTLSYSLLIANPHPIRVALGGPWEALVSIVAPEGNMFVFKQSLPVKTNESAGLLAGEEISVPGTWVLPPEAASGDYWIVARLSDDVGTYRQCFTVQTQDAEGLRRVQGD